MYSTLFIPEVSHHYTSVPVFILISWPYFLCKIPKEFLCPWSYFVSFLLFPALQSGSCTHWKSHSKFIRYFHVVKLDGYFSISFEIWFVPCHLQAILIFLEFFKLLDGKNIFAFLLEEHVDPHEYSDTFCKHCKGLKWYITVFKTYRPPFHYSPVNL